MKNLKHLFCLTLTAIIFIACKKNKHQKTPENSQTQPTETYYYIPVKFENDENDLTLKYKDNTAQLIEIADTKGNKTLITYTKEEHPLKLEKYRNGILLNVVYYELPDKKTISVAQQFNYDPITRSFTPLSSFTLTYNEQQRIHTINYYDKTVNLIKTHRFSYVVFGNISENTITPHTGSATVTNYTSDQKKGINSHINYSELFALEAEHWFFLCSVNNILNSINQKSPQENINFKYEYNENGYPSNMTMTKNNNTQHIKIIYKQMIALTTLKAVEP